jgi:excisionase family DNA binding protein
VITVLEYAATFCADERTVRRAIKDGQIQALQVGTTWRIPVAPLLSRCGIDLENSEGGPASPPVATTPTPLNAIGQSHDHPSTA